jgi:MFS transporter, DHA1 family, inner membrane transport protein
VPPLQLRVMTAAADAPNVASAMNIGAFNLGKLSVRRRTAPSFPAV